MKRTIAVLLVAAAVASAAVSAVYNTDQSVTSSNASVSFTDNGSGGSSASFRATYVKIESLTTSANTCFFDLRDTTATTADTKLAPGAVWEQWFDTQTGPSGMGAVCDTAQTATFRITAMRNLP